MVNSTISNGSDLIESIDVDHHQVVVMVENQDHDTSKTKQHLFSTEIFERDELWNDFNIVQQVDANSSNKASSGVWKYFGKLHYDNQIVDEGYFYCISCYANRVTKKYQTNRSTGNLIKHMIRAHDILLEQPVYSIKWESDSYTVIKEEFNKSDLDTSDPINSAADIVVNDINQILIDEVHKRPQLYDPRLCHKNKHRIRQSLWLQVYETLNHLIPLERLPKIWKNIRDRYQKVRRSCERDVNKVPKHRYYEKLRFLDSVIDSSMMKSYKGSQSALTKMEGDEDYDESKEEKCGYYIEDDEKNQDELFEVLELDVDDMDNVEVNNENNDSYDDDETAHEVNPIKCENDSRIQQQQRMPDELNDTDELTHYEYHSQSEIDESELFSIHQSSDVVQSPPPKRAKIDTPASQEMSSHQPSEISQPQTQKVDGMPQKSLSTTTTTASAPSSSALCEFDIFGNSMAAVMKNMRKNDARQLQMKIVQLINSYDEDDDVGATTV